MEFVFDRPVKINVGGYSNVPNPLNNNGKDACANKNPPRAWELNPVA